MDSNTGTFHPVEEENRPTKDEKNILHPDMRALILEASKERVPKDWLIISLDDEFTIGSHTLKIVGINSKDITATFVSDLETIPTGTIFEMQGHKFRVRKQYHNEVTTRSVIGKPHNYVKT